MMIKKQKIIFGLVAVFIIVLFFGFNLWQSVPRAGELKVAFLDVGQGDAELIVTPDKSKILIDGGPDERVLGELSAELPFYDRELDLVILTHPHADHLDGLLAVLQRYAVKKVLISGVVHTAPNYIKFLEELKKKNIPVEIAVSGERFKFGEATLEILWPEKDLSGERISGGVNEGGGLNDTSIVAQLVYGKNGFLFMGDAGTEVEGALLLSSKIQLRGDVIKIGHHGSTTASSEQFLGILEPEVAVISAGKNNRYGHPSLRIIRKLERVGAKIYQTFEDGRIIIKSDGVSLFEP